MSHLYYKLKPYIPRNVQIFLRRQHILLKRPHYKDVWPIDPKSHVAPPGWRGWPDGKRFALVLSHDVETQKGLCLIPKIVKMEQAFGFRSSFNFVAGDYVVSDSLLDFLRESGCEIGVHGLHHKGNLFDSYDKFMMQAKEINAYLKKWQAVGFRSPSMYHNLEWIHHLDIEYDASTFDTDPFEPQNDGTGTIFPFHVHNAHGSHYVELPYTLPQDFTIFILMGEKNIDIWKRKAQWVAEHGGMVLGNVHPDYMNDGQGQRAADEYPIELYNNFLIWIYETYKNEYWQALPREVAQYFSQQQNIPSIKTSATETCTEKLSPQEIGPERDEEWDRFVRSHPDGWITHLSGWRRTLEKSYPHIKGHQIALLDQDHHIQACLPIYEVRSWLTGNRLVSVPFATLGDPLITTAHDFELLYSEVDVLSKRLSIPRKEIKTLNTANLIKTEALSCSRHFVHHVLELDEPDKMKKKFHYKSVTYEINKAAKHHLELLAAKDEEDLKTFYRLYSATRKRLGLPPQPYVFFQMLWRTFQPDHLNVWLAKYENQIIAALMTFKFGRRVSSEALGWDNRLEKISPNHFLYWEVIKRSYEEGYNLFDFGRTALDNTNLLNFKKHWGTTILDLPQFQAPAASGRNPIGSGDSNKVKIVKAICRHIPQGLYSYFGDFCYRHLG